MATPLLTPRKSKADSCVLCGVRDNNSIRKRILHSKTNLEKELPRLLEKYGGVTYVDGFMCRGCERKLQTLNSKVKDFEKLCSSTAATNSKRLPTIISTPQDKSRQRLSTLSSPPFAASTPNHSRSKIRISLSFQKTPSPSKGKKKDDSGISLNESLDSLSIQDEPSALKILQKPLKSSIPVLTRKPTPKIAPKPRQSRIPVSSKVHQVREKDILSDHQYHSKTSNTDPQYVSKCAPKLKRNQPRKGAGFQVIPDHDYMRSLSISDVKTSTYLANSTFKDMILKYQAFVDGKLPLVSDNDWLLLQKNINEKDLGELIQTVMHSEMLKQTMTHALMRQNANTISQMKNRKHGAVSYLMKKDYAELANFEWMHVLEESLQNFPELMSLALGLCVEEHNLDNLDVLRKVVPKLGMVYAILAQQANHELSKVQRVMSLIMYDNICDQKVKQHFF